MGNALSIAISIGVPLLSGSAIGISMRDDVTKWYPTLKKPSWNPPNWLFGPAWSVLYTVMGVASWRVWNAGGGPLPLTLYGLQLAMNLAWSPLFFKKHDLKAATIDITVLLGVLVATVVEFHKVDPTAAALMLPYVAWTTFAGALTWNIFLNNSKEGREVKAGAKRAGEKAQSTVSGAASKDTSSLSGSKRPGDALGVDPSGKASQATGAARAHAAAGADAAKEAAHEAKKSVEQAAKGTKEEIKKKA